MEQDTKEPVVNETTTERKDFTFQEMLDNNKSYQAEFDRRVQQAITTAKSNWTTKEVEKKDSEDVLKLTKEIADLKKSIEDDKAKRKAEADDLLLTNNIKNIIKDKEFINEYTKNAIINEIKSSYKAKGNEKSIDDLFSEIIKDKNDIFVNPNQPKDVPGVSDDVYGKLDKEAFNKMSYKERLALKNENPDLFKQLNS